MLKALSKLSLHQKLGLLALGLGAVAVFANVRPGRTVTVHEKELLTAVERQEDHVIPAELASWIITGRADYRLVDLRDATAYATYHIPTAESIPLASLPDAGLARNEKIVLYGQGGIHAAQAWMLLKGKGYAGAYTLLGGLDAWKDEVLFPVAPQSPTPAEQARFERAVQVARFFGGQPRAGAASGNEPPLVALPLQTLAPVVAAPTLPAGTGAAAPKGRKKEGC
jgi:rhodanese-related sulfurtransferase